MSYRMVHLRIRSKGYNSKWESDTDESAFKEESRRIFQELGWALKPGGNGICDIVTKENQDANGGGQDHELAYAYKCRDCFIEGADSVEAVVPPIKTRVTFTAQGRERTGYYREGYAFSPMFTLGYTGKIREGEVFTTWLKLAREG